MKIGNSNLIESTIFSGFYHNPDFEWIVVSREGRVIDQRNMFCLIPVMGVTWPYMLVNVWGYGTKTLHRLVASTFLYCPGDRENFVVNHIDGDKTNNSADNLEWVTSSENAIHAYVTGLRDDNCPVLVRDLRNEAVERYYSLNEAARRFNVNPSIVHRYLNSDQLVPWKKYYDMVYEDQPWKPLTSADIGRVPNGHPKDVVLVDKVGNVIVFGSGSDLARYMNITPSAAQYCLSRTGELPSGELVTYLEEFSGNLEIAKRIERVKTKIDRPNFRRKPVPVVVTDLADGSETNWDSVEAFARSVGASKNTIQKSMLVKDGVWRGYRIRYVNSVPPI